MVYTLNIGSDTEIAERVVEKIKTKTESDCIFSEGAFWFYNRTEWQTLHDILIDKVIRDFDGATYDTGHKLPEVVRLSNNKVKSIVERMKMLVKNDDFFTTKADGINCLNGFVQFDANGIPTLTPHDPQHRCRHTIQARWHPDTTWHNTRFSRYIEVLLETLEEEDRADISVLFQQIAGAAVAGLGGNRLKQPRAFIGHGRSANNGKSKVLILLRKLVPPHAVSTVNPGKFGDEKYSVQLVGKLLNTADELSSAKSIASDAFKTIITGDPMQGRDLYKSVIDFRCGAVHFFAANRLPFFVGGLDQGVRRRVAIIHFARSIPQDKMLDPEIVEEMFDSEMDVILAWAVAGAQRLIANGRRYDIPACVERENDLWLQGNDPVAAACHARVRTDKPEPRGYTEFAVYRAIKNWCEYNGGFSHIPDKTEIIARFYDLFPQCRGKRTATSRHVIHGIRIMASDFADEDGISDTERVIDQSTGELSHTIGITHPDNPNQPINW